MCDNQRALLRLAYPVIVDLRPYVGIDCPVSPPISGAVVGGGIEFMELHLFIYFLAVGVSAGVIGSPWALELAPDSSSSSEHQILVSHCHLEINKNIEFRVISEMDVRK